MPATVLQRTEEATPRAIRPVAAPIFPPTTKARFNAAVEDWLKDNPGADCPCVVMLLPPTPCGEVK